MSFLYLVVYVSFFVGVFLATGAVAGNLEASWSARMPSRPRAAARRLPLHFAHREGKGAPVMGFLMLLLLPLLPALLRPCTGGECRLGEWMRREEARNTYLDHQGLPLVVSGGYAYRTLGELPRHLVDLAVAVEDRRFYWHPCVDPIGVARAAAAGMLRGRREGGSTICMQAVRGLDRDGVIRRDGTWGGKVAETRLALELFARTGFSRRRVLELYLNRVYLGTGRAGEPVYGVEAAAWAYFGKPATALTLAESALLVGMIQAPGRYEPGHDANAALGRRNVALRLLVRHDGSYASRASAAAAEPLGYRPGRLPPHMDLAARLDAYVPSGSAGVVTTVDPRTQMAARGEALGLLRAVSRGAYGPYRVGDPANPLSAGVLVMDPRNGAVRAWACGRPGRTGLEGWDICGRGRISLASTQKVWLTLFALDREVAAPDEPLSSVAARAGRAARQAAYTRQFCTPAALRMTVRQAFAVSHNCLAVLLLAALPADALAALRRMGIEADPQRPTTALGTGTISPAMLAAYVGALDNGGVVPTPHLAAGIELATPPVSQLEVGQPAIAAMRTMMRSVVLHGTAVSASPVLVGRPAFAKTGTAENHDVRIVGGIAGGRIALVWLGHPTPRPMLRDMDAGRMLAPAWARILRVD